MLKVYYADSYGSVCCPRDPKWDRKQDDTSFIKEYERNNKVKLRIPTGKIMVKKENMPYIIHYRG